MLLAWGPQLAVHSQQNQSGAENIPVGSVHIPAYTGTETAITSGPVSCKFNSQR